MKIKTYIKRNWDKLPKSTFNDIPVVIFLEKQNSDCGGGNHTYVGVGVDEGGDVVECSSSGCSCSGTAFIDKTSMPEGEFNWREIEFAKLQVSFSNY